MAISYSRSSPQRSTLCKKGVVLCLRWYIQFISYSILFLFVDLLITIMLSYLLISYTIWFIIKCLHQPTGSSMRHVSIRHVSEEKKLCLLSKRMCTFKYIQLHSFIWVILLHFVQALLSGCSAGGLAVFLHCDNFTSYLPNNASVKCLSDAGFFLDA